MGLMPSSVADSLRGGVSTPSWQVVRAIRFGQMNRGGTGSNGHALDLDVYGLRVRIEDPRQAISGLLGLDYAWFASPPGDGGADLDVVIGDERPDIRRFTGARAISIGPRSVLYRWNGHLVTDMGGNAIVEYEPLRKRVLVNYRDEQVAHEALFTFLNKRINTHFDKLGLVRLHALALVGQHGGATALMLPSGGGKTTLALQVLESDGVKLLSDDAPLIDRRGMVYPFPLRMGLTASDAPAEARTRLRPIELMEARAKLAIEVETFKDRIAAHPEPLRHLVIGRRVLTDKASLYQARRRDAVGPLFRESIVRPNFYEGLRILQENGGKEKVQKFRGLAGRAVCCASFLKGARVWALDMGTNHASNRDALLPLLEGRR